MDKYQKQFDKNGSWTCEDCGITYSHKPTLDSHNIQGRVRNKLRFNPLCNCGIHEAAELHNKSKLDADDEIVKAIENNNHKYYPIPSDVKKENLALT